MRVVGDDVRPAADFKPSACPDHKAQSAFTTVRDDGMLWTTRRAAGLLSSPDSTTAIAPWDGQYRTDAFVFTVGELREKAKAWPNAL